MREKIEVFVNGRKIAIYRGMNVKHALISYDQSVYAAALAGQVRVEDENGFLLGLEGALADGAKIFTVGSKV
ncbi:MAG: hypothetical protein M1398_01270 [Deltaproteobacteria bacterium]|nr:hypothetical protein [Deltaproteobacteria bacterium]MDA8306074.1 hypothetical protein [Deltaproteobacteria bacterium]